MKASVMAPGAVESQAGGVPVTKAVLRAVSMSGAFPAGKAFSEAGPRDRRAEAPSSRYSPGPTVIFSNCRRQTFPSHSSALGSQRAEDGQGRMGSSLPGRVKGLGLPSLGSLATDPLGAQASTCPV